MRQILSILLVALLAIPVPAPAKSQTELPTKIIVRIHVTKLWLAENADLDMGGNDPDLWLFTLAEQIGLGKSVRSFGERSIDPKDYDTDQNNRYDPKKDRTLSPLELMGGKGVQDTVIYSSEQCKPVRLFNLYFRMIDSDIGGSDKSSFFDKVANKLSGYLEKFLTKGVKFIVSGLVSVIGKLFENSFDLVGVGRKMEWLPAKRYEVLRGSSGGDWNLGPEKAWKDGELPPPGKTWVSEETRVDLKSGGKLGAIVWYRLVAYNTGDLCARAKPEVEKVGESKASIESIEVSRGLEARKLVFEVTFGGPIDELNIDLSISVQEGGRTDVYRVLGESGNLSWSGEGLKITGGGNRSLIGELSVDAAEVNVTFASLVGGEMVSRASVLARLPGPDVVLIANRVDRIGLDPLLHGLRSRGLELSIRGPPGSLQGLRELASETPVLIAGGPDAYEGVGELVRRLLPKDVADAMRREAKLARVDWLAENPVYIAAGPDRYATRSILSSLVSLVVDEATKHDRSPPVVEMGPGIFMGEEQDLEDIGASGFLLSEPARLSEVNLTYMALGQEVPLLGGRVTIHDRWVELELPAYRPDELILTADLADLRNNSATVRLKFRSGSTVPFLVMSKVSEEQEGPLSKTFTLEAANLGTVRMTLQFSGVQGAPPFIRVEARPQMCLIEPGLSTLVDLRVVVSEEAPKGTYTFTVVFENLEAGVYEPVNVTVVVSRGET